MRTLVNFALRREPAVIRILFFLGPLLTLLVPKATVAIIVLLSLCCIGLALARGGDIKSLFRMDITLALFAVTALYLFLNASWSLDPERAFSKAVWFALVVAMSYGASRALAVWPQRSLQMAATAFLLGVSVGAAIILFEIATDRFLTLSAYKFLPITQPGSLKEFLVENGEIMRIPAAEINHNVAVMLIALWPALLCAMTRFHGRARWLCAGGLFFAMLAALFLSEHDSSKAGLVLSVLVFAIARPLPDLTRKAVWLGWCLAFVLVIPLATSAYKADWHKADWLPFSAQARVTLWAYTTEQIPDAPLFGIGGSSTRKMDMTPENRQKHWKQRQKTEGFGWRAGAHAHNAFLQTWYELGAVGVILFVITGSAVILSVRTLPAATQSYTLGHITAFLSIIAFSWGMWQGWLVALAGLAALYIALAVNFFRGGAVAEP